MGKEFASIALIEDVACENSTIFSLVGDPDRCFAAFNGLLEKQVFTKCRFEGYCQPAINMYYRLAPQKGMVILSYKDLETEVGHKYYVFPDSLMELSADANSITFNAVKELDYSLWT